MVGFGVASGGRYDHTWYEKAKEDLLNWTSATELAPIFLASETYANASVTPTALSIDERDVEPLDGFISPGPMLGRVVLATAVLPNSSYLLVREYVQPYNFSHNLDGSMSFLVPPWAPGIADDDGYAVVTVGSASGPKTTLRLALFYSEDCPRPGHKSYGLHSYGLYS